MSWIINFSRHAKKFADEKKIKDMVIGEVKKFLFALKGLAVSVNVKKLKGKLKGNWKDFYRIRRNKIRIIFSVNTAKKVIFIDRIDFRGDVYK